MYNSRRMFAASVASERKDFGVTLSPFERKLVVRVNKNSKKSITRYSKRLYTKPELVIFKAVTYQLSHSYSVANVFQYPYMCHAIKKLTNLFALLKKK